MQDRSRPDWLLTGYPWIGLGDEVTDQNAYERLSDMARDGEQLIEPGERVRCYLRRLTDAEQARLTAERTSQRRHTAVALWTEDVDNPRDLDDRIELLEEHEAARIENNSLTTAIKAAVGRYKDSADAGLDPASPAGRLIDPIVARRW